MSALLTRHPGHLLGDLRLAQIEEHILWVPEGARPNPSPLLKAAWKWLKTHSPAEERAEVGPAPSRILQQQRRLNPEEEAAVIAAYKSGLSVYAVGAQFSIHRTSVSAIMRRHSLPMRRRTRGGSR